MAKVTLYDLKEKMATLQAQIAADAEWIAEKAADPSTEMKDITAKKEHRDELNERFNLLKAQHDEMEKKQRADVESQPIAGEKDETVKAKAAFFKTALTGGNVNEVRKVYSGLGAIPVNTADIGYGENLLPTTMETELITEPFETNSLRTIEQVSQVTGLVEPKLLFEIEDADLADITDAQTAKEIALTGADVEYGRFKTKISATVKDTVLHGTPTNLVATIENALRSGLAKKEKMRAFNTTPDGTHDHMSFYLKTGIKAVAGDDMIDAILKALGDLSDSYSENASVVMRKTDYYAAVNKLANGGATLWGKKPEDVIGYPVIFNDKAVVPVIGDFRYARQNYDIGTIYETDKDGKKGEYYFILTAWGDHQIKLASAFRTAFVRAILIGASIKYATAGKEGEKLSIDELVFNDGGTGAAGAIAYKWQQLVGTTWTDLTIAYGTGGNGYATDELTTLANSSGDSYRCGVTYTDDDGAPSVVFSNPITMLDA